MNFIRLLPLVGFVLLVGVVLIRLGGDAETGDDSSDIMIGRPAPTIELPLLALEDSQKKFSTEALDGRVTLINFWASWCAPCRLEHPLLMQLAQDDRFDMIGINYKDSEKNALTFLRQLGNPYRLVATDRRGRAAIEWGVLGAPETYLVNRQGLISYRHIGPLDADTITTKLLPAIHAALQ